jgi:hypothetical protein
MTEPQPVPPSAPEASEGPTPDAILPLRLLPPPPDGTILTPPEQHEAAARTWFFGQLWADLRLAVRMYFDARYRVSRTAQLAFPVFAALLVFNYFFFSMWFSITIVSPVAERLLDVLIVVVAYRVLVRELDRYRAVLDYLAKYAAAR